MDGLADFGNRGGGVIIGLLGYSTFLWWALNEEIRSIGRGIRNRLPSTIHFPTIHTEKESLRSRLAKVGVELESVIADNAHLRWERSNLESKVKYLTSDADNLRRDNANLSARLTSARREIERLKSEKNVPPDQINTLKAMIKQLREELARVKAEKAKDKSNLNPEWTIGLANFERRWQAAKSKLPPVRPGDTGNEQEYVLARFKAGMNIVHEVSLEPATNIPEKNTRVRAGIEYLIPEIWPDNRSLKKFFDPNFNAGFLTPDNLAKIICMPESYRKLSSFTKNQIREIKSIQSTLIHALHPDILRRDADPKLQDSINTLLVQLNSAWPLIRKIIENNI